MSWEDQRTFRVLGTSPSLVTPSSGVSRTPSTSRPSVVTVYMDYSTSTPGAGGTVDITADGIALPQVNFQNPLAAGTWNQDAARTFYLPTNASYTVTTGGSGSHTLRAQEWVF